MGLFKKDEPRNNYPVSAVSQPANELPFLLQPDERLEATAMNMQYRGPTMITSTLGGGLGGDHLFGGIATSKSQKRENSAFDAKSCDCYLTNHRLVLVKHGSKGGIAGNIPLKAIQALSAGSFISGQNIQLSFQGAQGVDNASIIFVAKLYGDDRLRKAERDVFLTRTRELLDLGLKTSAVPVAAPAEDPMQVLKMRLAKGEITPQQFEEMKKLLS